MADEVTKSIRPKLITTTIISIMYDLPRLYLNVNLFGSLCSFYYIYINPSTDTFTFSYQTGNGIDIVQKVKKKLKKKWKKDKNMIIPAHMAFLISKLCLF